MNLATPTTDENEGRRARRRRELQLARDVSSLERLRGFAAQSAGLVRNRDEDEES